eukprot:10420508-Ditylum_brightwellii.AAC.1
MKTSSINDSGSDSSLSSDNQKRKTLDESEPSFDESGVVKIVYLRMNEKMEEVVKNSSIYMHPELHEIRTEYFAEKKKKRVIWYAACTLQYCPSAKKADKEMKAG